MGAWASKARVPATPPPSSEASSCSHFWPDLPPELAGLVLRRLPSLADRVRFGSVCRHWRHGARQQAQMLPPVLPWTIADWGGIVQTIPDGEVHRLCSRHLAFCAGSSENWLLMIRRTSPDDTESRNFLENPLSGATLPLPGNELRHVNLGLYWFSKFVVCPDNLVVATVRIPNNDTLIACCWPGTFSWSTSSQSDYLSSYDYEDIAFYDQSICAITMAGDLFAHEVSDTLSSAKLVIKASDPSRYGVSQFLLVSRGGTLLMVKWNHGWGKYDDDISAFEVFEADLQMSRWSRLSSIGDQVLFVSENCSKAVHVSPNHDNYLRGNHIYFLGSAFFGPQKCCSGRTSCGMYDLRNNTYCPILSDVFAQHNDVRQSSWFFPQK